MTPNAEQPEAGQSIPAKIREKYDAIESLLEPFCRERLNDEYRAVIGRLLGVLARKRPSPLVNGTAAAWACGIARSIGWVNFLDDKSQKPHMKMAEIDKAFGVSSGTGQAKSKTIRTMLRIRTFEPEWTLPSRLDTNPTVWLIQVNGGMIIDARFMPREIQEEAFQRGMIPYIPADRQEKANNA